MHHTGQANQPELAELTRILSLYKGITLPQIKKCFPTLSKSTISSLIRTLVRRGRAVYQKDSELLQEPFASPLPEGLLPALWVMLDFYPDVIYHTASDYPVLLTFFTPSESFDVIYIPTGKELLINTALSACFEENSRRLAVIEDICQISSLTFPGITAFCRVSEDGSIQYYQKGNQQ